MNRHFEAFLIFKASNDGSSNRTVRAYSDVLTRFESWLGDRDPLTVGHDELLVFTGPWAHKQLGLSPTSRTPYVACIRELYRWLHSVAQRIDRNPAEQLPYPKRGRPLPRTLSLENAERLMWAPDFSTFAGVRDAAMLAVMIGCGLRVAGVVALNESCIVRQVVGGESRLALRPLEKGAKERLVPIPREADLLLRIYLEHPELTAIDRHTATGDRVLFVTTRNRRCPTHEYYGERRRWSTRGVFDMVRRHGKRAGIPLEQLHPHALRHLFGTELAESDVDLLIRQRFMGHADAKSTAIYEDLAMRKLTASLDRGNPLGKIKTPATQLLAELTASQGRSPRRA